MDYLYLIAPEVVHRDIQGFSGGSGGKTEYGAGALYRLQGMSKDLGCSGADNYQVRQAVFISLAQSANDIVFGINNRVRPQFFSRLKAEFVYISHHNPARAKAFGQKKIQQAGYTAS